MARLKILKSKPKSEIHEVWPSDLEEVDLHGAVGEVQHDGAAGAEPVREVGQASQLVAVTPRHVGAGLQQVLAHVVTEVLE